MTFYRLYFMNPHSGHIDDFAAFDSPDDDSAAALASEQVGHRPLELWDDGRKVRRFDGAEIGHHIGESPVRNFG